jgi:hypothetical protein
MPADVSFVHELTCPSCAALVRFEGEPPPWKPYPPITVSRKVFGYGREGTIEVYPPFKFVECPSCKGRIDRRIWKR